MSHLLDRPIWSALNSHHASLAEGGERAKRYHSAIVPFVAAADDEEPSLRALGELVGRDETVYLVSATDIVLPAALVATFSAPLVQMEACERMSALADPRIEPLTEADAAEMLELATLTKPGPFTLRAQSLGTFWGVRIEGRLAAMAGQRLRQPGYAELSGVCTHPDFQGRGLARLLSLHVVDTIFARGETPYLHCYASNAPAIRLYESIGFRLRSPMNVTAARRAG